MVCASDARPIKGVREAAKRAWHELGHFIAIDKGLLDAVVARVVEGTLDSETVDDEIDGSGEEDASDEESDDGDDVAIEALRAAEKEEAENIDEDDEEASSKAGLLHDETADAALAQMIGLRKQNRKKGFLDAKRRELLLNTRCIDFLEVNARLISAFAAC
jgi:hypothetical protein